MYISDSILIVYHIMKKMYFLIIGVVIFASIMITWNNQNNLLESQKIPVENIFTLSSNVENDSENSTSQLPIHISSDDFVNGIHFTDLNAIEGVSQEKVIVIDGILEYVD